MMLYSVIKSFVLPPGLMVVLLVGAFFAARGVLARLLIFIVLSTLTLLSLPVVSAVLMAPLEPYPAIGAAPDAIRAGGQAILVLGGGRRRDAPEYGGETLDDASLRRVRYAARLHRASGLPVYVTGGRLASEGAPVGQLMAETLRADFGVKVARAETASRTTWENATFTIPMLVRDGIDRVLLVSDAWHLPRAVALFQGLGMQVTPAPTAFLHDVSGAQPLTYRDWLPSASAFERSAMAVHEHLGQAWYQLRDLLDRPASAPVAGSPPASS